MLSSPLLCKGFLKMAAKKGYYRLAGQEEVKMLLLPRCTALAGSDADEDLVDFVAAALVEQLTDHAESGGDLLETATEVAVPYLSSFLEEEKAAVVVKEVIDNLAVGKATVSTSSNGKKAETAPSQASTPTLPSTAAADNTALPYAPFRFSSQTNLYNGVLLASFLVSSSFSEDGESLRRL